MDPKQRPACGPKHFLPLKADIPKRCVLEGGSLRRQQPPYALGEFSNRASWSPRVPWVAWQVLGATNVSTHIHYRKSHKVISLNTISNLLANVLTSIRKKTKQRITLCGFINLFSSLQLCTDLPKFKHAHMKTKK